MRKLSTVARGATVERSGATGRRPASFVVTDKIYLVGFMAAGKTTVARALAARLGWRAEDVDELIEARERRPVADIFARQGEAYFRSLEREILKLLLPIRHAVVATGGGTFMDVETRAAINLDGLSVWLDIPFETVVTRIPADGRRPLAADRAQMERLFIARQTVYAQAHIRVNAGAARAEEIAEQILDRMSKA
jgi:shikimate kinase